MVKRTSLFVFLFVLLSLLALTTPAMADGPQGKVKGTIAAVDPAAGTVTITPKNGGADVTLNVDASTFIRRGGMPATLTDLQVGDRVKAKYDPATMLASRIDAKSAKQANLKGIIAAVDVAAGTVSITPKQGGAAVTLSVDATTWIKRDGMPATLADLQVGDRVKAKYNPFTMLASKIDAKSAVPFAFPEVEGTLTAVGASSITIAPEKGGAEVTLSVDASTVIRRNKMPATLADLQVGDKVEARYDPATMIAVKIEAKSVVAGPPPTGLAKVEGRLTAVGASSVTIAPEKGGPEVTLNVDASTFIERDHMPATLADLQVGDKVEAKYDPATMVATKIEAKSAMAGMPPSTGLAKVEGRLTAVNGSSVTIAPKKGGAEVTLTVDASTLIERDHMPVTLADLHVGNKVEARYDPATMIATKIEVED